jgi:hypothetical protein
VRVLEGAGARLLDPASPGYHGPAAREAWSRTLDFLRQALA